MAKIPFDIKFRPQIESGEYKVVNSYGEPVRIICWDARIDFPNGIRPIISLQLIDGKYEVVSDHLKNGKIYSFKDAPADLFIVTPEEELSEFEKVVKDRLWRTIEYSETFRKDENKWVQGLAAELIALAKKELLSEKMLIEQTYNPDINKAHELGRKEGIILGKAEALKDLPRWKKCDPHTIYNTKFNLVNGCGRYLMVDGYQIDIDLLLEKLPGFKEDEK